MQHDDQPSAVFREAGIALVAVLLFSIALLALAGSMLTSAVAVHNHGRSMTAARRAEQAADSGIHLVIAQMRVSQESRDALVAAETLTGVLMGDAGSENAVSYCVTIQSGAADGLDNDLDGAVDEPDEACTYEVASTGSADNVRRTVMVTVRQELTAFTSPGAVYVGDPNMEIEFKDNPNTLFSGVDVDLNGNPTGLLVPGIGVAGDPSGIRAQWPAGKPNDVIGLRQNWSIHQVDPLGSIDHILALADAAPPVNLEDTSIDFPGIVNIRTGDDVEIVGTVRGAGVLVIDGEFEIDEGTLIWDGLVIVRGGRGGEEVEIEEGRLEITGAMIFLGNAVEETEFEESTTVVQYSQAMLDRVVPPVPTGYKALNWRDGPNP